MYKRPSDIRFKSFKNKNGNFHHEPFVHTKVPYYFHGQSQEKLFGIISLPRLERQYDKEVKPYLYDEEDEKEYGSPYMEIANDSRYLYLHVQTFYGWGIKEDETILFLYDSVKREVTYRKGDFQKKIRLPFFCGIINVDEMSRCNPNVGFFRSFDSSYYYIFMKSGDMTRHLCIDAILIGFYGPFLWVIEAFDKEKIGNPCIERFKKIVLMYICSVLKRIPFLGKIDYFAPKERFLKFYFHYYYKKKNIFSPWIENITWYRYYYN